MRRVTRVRLMMVKLASRDGSKDGSKKVPGYFQDVSGQSQVHLKCVNYSFLVSFCLQIIID